MKMKYLKTFENFGDQDFGRFSDVDSDEQEWLKEINPNNDEFRNEFEEEDSEIEDEIEEEGDQPKLKTWGDEIVEKKKMNAGFKAYLDKKKSKAKKGFEETMKKADKDKREDDKKDCKK